MDNKWITKRDNKECVGYVLGAGKDRIVGVVCEGDGGADGGKGRGCVDFGWA